MDKLGKTKIRMIRSKFEVVQFKIRDDIEEDDSILGAGAGSSSYNTMNETASRHMSDIANN